MKELLVDADFIRRIAKHGPYKVTAHSIGPMSISGTHETRHQGRYTKTLAQSIEALLNQIAREAR